MSFDKSGAITQGITSHLIKENTVPIIKQQYGTVPRENSGAKSPPKLVNFNPAESQGHSYLLKRKDERIRNTGANRLTDDPDL